MNNKLKKIMGICLVMVFAFSLALPVYAAQQTSSSLTSKLVSSITSLIAALVINSFSSINQNNKNKYNNEFQQDFTKFDYEINKKIDTLFDAYTTNREKDMVLEDNITSLKAKTFDHDIRISNIENKGMRDFVLLCFAPIAFV